MTEIEQKNIQEILLGYSSMKAIQIIYALSYLQKPCGSNEIAALTGLAPSSVYRVLQELIDCGFAVRSGKKYMLGPQTLSLSRNTSIDGYVLDAASAEMTRLNNLSGETVHLIALEGLHAVYSGKIDSKHSIGLHSYVGKHVPLYCTSGGKILLASQDKKWLDMYLKSVPLQPLTQSTITDKQTLLRELEKIRAQGYAIDDGEYNYDVVCVSAPIFFSEQYVGSTISIATPRYRIDAAKLNTYKEEVIKSAKRISSLLQ